MAFVNARTYAVASCSIGISIAVMDGVGTSSLLPSISASLSITGDQAMWLVAVYQWALLSGILCFSTLGNHVGYKKVYLSGMAVTIVASVMAMLSHHPTSFFVARLFQGLGSSCIMGVNTSLLRFVYPPDRLGRGLGFNSLVTAFASTSGPLASSASLFLGTWHYMYLLYIPFLLLAGGMGGYFLPTTPYTPSQTRILEVFLIIALFFVFSMGGAYLIHYMSFLGVLLWITTLAIIFYLTVLSSKKNTTSIFPHDLLKSHTVKIFSFTSSTAYSVQIIMFTILPFYLVYCHVNHLWQAITLSLWPFSLGICAIFSGRAADYISPTKLVSTGIFLLGCGVEGVALGAYLHRLSVMMAFLLVCGVGFGLFQAPNNRLIMSSSSLSRSGSAGGLIGLARVSGQVVGALIATMILSKSNFEGNYLITILTIVGLFVILASLSPIISYKYTYIHKPDSPNA